MDLVKKCENMNINTHIKVPLKVRDTIFIRNYIVKSTDVDAEQLDYNGRLIVPGTTWAGAIRHRMFIILYDLGLTEKQAKENNNLLATQLIYEKQKLRVLKENFATVKSKLRVDLADIQAEEQELAKVKQETDFKRESYFRKVTELTSLREQVRQRGGERALGPAAGKEARARAGGKGRTGPPHAV